MSSLNWFWILNHHKLFINKQTVDANFDSVIIVDSITASLFYWMPNSLERRYAQSGNYLIFTEYMTGYNKDRLIYFLITFCIYNCDSKNIVYPCLEKNRLNLIPQRNKLTTYVRGFWSRECTLFLIILSCFIIYILYFNSLLSKHLQMLVDLHGSDDTSSLWL